jgi:hypothetical protein
MGSQTTGPGTARRILLLLAAAALVGLLAASVAPAEAAVWRPFAQTSVWNVPAAQKGAITGTNPYASQFTSYSSTLGVSGVGSNQWSKPIFFAQPGDPARTGRDVNGWPKGDIRYDGGPIPVPSGLQAATGSDGHLTIVSADRTKAWDMWRCKQASGAPCTEQNVLASGYRAEVIVQWNLAGSGVAGDRNDNTSARGSGTPLIPTTIRAEEALNGIDHAIGLTIPHVASDYVFPATHSDGSSGSVKYGTLFVLRADYPVTAGASVGERNIIAALKTYGAYIVDQGASMELDADSNRSDLWSAAGLAGNPSIGIHAGDWRFVDVSAAPSPAPAPLPLPEPAAGPAPSPGPMTSPGTGPTGATTGTTTGGKRCTTRQRRRGRCVAVKSAHKKARHKRSVRRT